MVHSGPFLGPWAKLANIGLVLLSRLIQGAEHVCKISKIAKSGLALLSGLTQGTCGPNFKRFKPKLREEIGF